MSLLSYYNFSRKYFKGISNKKNRSREIPWSWRFFSPIGIGVDVESSLNYWTKSVEARRALRERPRKRLVRSFLCLFPIACPTSSTISSVSHLSDKSRKWAGVDIPISRRERTISAQAIILMSTSRARSSEDIAWRYWDE